MPPGVEQLALLINFDHKSRNPTSISNAKLMLYILQNRNSLAIAWNGRAPQRKTVARWEVRNPIASRKG